MSINSRIRLLVRELGLNNNSFAKQLNVSPTVTFNVLRGRETKPSYALLENILLTFDNVSAEWLLRGNGDIFQDALPEKPVPHSEVARILEEQLREANAANRELIRIIDRTLGRASINEVI